MSVQEHKQEAPDIVRCKVITVSDTRTDETDKSGKLMISFLEEAGHHIAAYEIVKTKRMLCNGQCLRAAWMNRQTRYS